jgi:hypothetical protein
VRLPIPLPHPASRISRALRSPMHSATPTRCSRAPKPSGKALKDEIKRRGLLEATGDSFAIRVSEQISGRLDVAAVKQHLGDAWRRFELATVSRRVGRPQSRAGMVIRAKSVLR